jgi:hypothetical protein
MAPSYQRCSATVQSPARHAGPPATAAQLQRSTRAGAPDCAHPTAAASARSFVLSHTSIFCAEESSMSVRKVQSQPQRCASTPGPREQPATKDKTHRRD